MILSLLAPLAHAATLTVGVGQPYATLDDALDAYVAGDVIELQAGTHELSSDRFSLLPGPLRLKGSGLQTTTLRADMGTRHLNGLVDIHLSDLTIEDIVFEAEGSNLMVRDVHLEDCVLVGTGTHGRLERVTAIDTDIYVVATESVTVRQVASWFEAAPQPLTTAFVTTADDSVLDVRGSTFATQGVVDFGDGFTAPTGRMTVKNNRFCDQVYPWFRADHMSLAIEKNTFIDTLNTVVYATRLSLADNTFYAADYVDITLSDRGRVVNNAFVNSTGGLGGFLTLSPTQLAVDYNLAYGTQLSASNVPGPHHVAADPLFVAPTDGCDADLSLQPGSPAIDAGHPSYLDPDGTVADIGAH